MTDHDKGEATKKRLADEKAAREKKQAEQREGFCCSAVRRARRLNVSVLWSGSATSLSGSVAR